MTHERTGPSLPEASRYLSPAHALRALDRLDLPAFRAAVAQLTATLDDLPDAPCCLVSALLHNLLCVTAQRLALGPQPVDETQQLLWLNGVTAAEPRDRLEFFSREIDRLLDPFSGARARANPIVLRARRYIDEHYAEKISLSLIAADLGVARNYLSSLFHRDCGVTLTTYIHQVRIGHARLMLSSGVRSLAEVADAVGYANYRHFYRSFLRICDLSPTKFLKQLREAPPSRPAAPAVSPPLPAASDLDRRPPSQL